ncbi:MAG: hypothetical protein ACRDRL_02490 [Sciscionella sp.]
MSAIPTFYDRIEYRSRLEARWAAFFDQLGWQYIYEPFDADHYIPDFIIHGDGPLLVEIKPVVTPEEYELVATEIDGRLGDDDGAWLNGVVVFGISPLPYAGYYLDSRVASISGEAGWYRCPACGAFAILRVQQARATVTRHDTRSYTLEEPASAAQNRKLQALFRDAGLQDRSERLTVITAILTARDPKPPLDRRRYAPCGHLVFGDYMESIDPQVIHQLWASACNNVKWRGRDA